MFFFTTFNWKNNSQNLFPKILRPTVNFKTYVSAKGKLASIPIVQKENKIISRKTDPALLFSNATINRPKKLNYYKANSEINQSVETLQGSIGPSNSAITAIGRPNRYRVLKLQKDPKASIIIKKPINAKKRENEELLYRKKEELSFKHQKLVFSKRGGFDDNDNEKMSINNSAVNIKPLFKKFNFYTYPSQNETWFSRFFKKITKERHYFKKSVFKTPKTFFTRIQLEEETAYRTNLKWLQKEVNSKNLFWWLQNRFKQSISTRNPFFQKIWSFTSIIAQEQINKSSDMFSQDNNFFETCYLYSKYKRTTKNSMKSKQKKIFEKNDTDEQEQKVEFFISALNKQSVKTWKYQNKHHFYQEGSQFFKAVQLVFKKFLFSKQNQFSLLETNSYKRKNIWKRKKKKNMEKYYTLLIFSIQLLKKINKDTIAFFHYNMAYFFYYYSSSKTFTIYLKELPSNFFDNPPFHEQIQEKGEIPYTRWVRNLGSQHKCFIQYMLSCISFFYQIEGQMHEIKKQERLLTFLNNKNKRIKKQFSMDYPKLQTLDVIKKLGKQFAQAISFWRQALINAKAKNWELEKKLNRKKRANWCNYRRFMRSSKIDLNRTNFKARSFFVSFFKNYYKSPVSKSFYINKKFFKKFLNLCFFEIKNNQNSDQRIKSKKKLIYFEQRYQTIRTLINRSFEGRDLMHFIQNRVQKRLPNWLDQGAQIGKILFWIEQEKKRKREEKLHEETIKSAPDTYWYNFHQIQAFKQKKWKNYNFTKLGDEKWQGKKFTWKKKTNYWAFSTFQKFFEWQRVLLRKTPYCANYKIFFVTSPKKLYFHYKKFYCYKRFLATFKYFHSKFSKKNVYNAIYTTMPSISYNEKKTYQNCKNRKYQLLLIYFNVVNKQEIIFKNTQILLPYYVNDGMNQVFNAKKLIKNQNFVPFNQSQNLTSTYEYYTRRSNGFWKQNALTKNIFEEEDYSFNWKENTNKSVLNQETTYEWKYIDSTEQISYTGSDLEEGAVDSDLEEEIFQLELSQSNVKTIYSNKFFQQRLPFMALPFVFHLFVGLTGIFNKKKLAILIAKSGIQEQQNLITLSGQSIFKGIVKNTIWSPSYYTDDEQEKINLETTDLETTDLETTDLETTDLETTDLETTKANLHKEIFYSEKNLCQLDVKPQIDFFFGNYNLMNYRSEFDEYINQRTICLILSPRRNNSFVVVQPKNFKSEKGERIFQKSAGQKSKFKGFVRRSPQNRKELIKDAAFALLRFNKKDSYYKFLDINFKNFMSTLNNKTAKSEQFQQYIKRTVAPFFKKQVSQRYPLINVYLLGSPKKAQKPAYRSRKHPRSAKQRMY